MRLFGRKKTVEAPEVEVVAPQLPPGPQLGEDGLRTVADHRNYLLDLTESLPPFGMLLLEALGLALCEEITAPGPLPHVATAALEGYAVSSADVADASHDAAVVLDLLDPDTLRLGGLAAVLVEENQILPGEADAVLPLAFGERLPGERGETVRVVEPVQAGEYVHPAGTDVEDGQVLASHGQVLDPQLVGLLAGMGIDKVLARPRPRVVVISTGTSLVEPGRPLPDGLHTHDANGYMVAALARQDGCQVWRLGVAPETADELRDAISDQLIRADLVVATGGAGEGEDDLLGEVISSLGLVDTAEVAMSPGRRQGFALIGEDKVPMVMLPGDPGGAFASYQAFVRPLIRKLMGVQPYEREQVRAMTRSVIRSTPGVFELVRATLRTEHGSHFVELHPGREDGGLSELAQSNALVLLDEATEVVQAGSPVMCWSLADPG